MPNKDDRIKLWRNTIQLFHKYNRPKFIGPFKAAGYKYVIERLFLDKNGNELNPDIVASGETGWLSIELTTSNNSKEPKLDKYSLIDPNYLSQYGLKIHDVDSDVLSSRLNFINDGNYCQLLVENKLSIRKDEYLKNQILKTELNKCKNLNLKKLLNIPITLVPEMKSKEIRRGLIEIIMQLFKPDIDGKKLIEIVDDGLERLHDKVSVTEKRSLMEKVKTQLNVLIGQYLSDYLELVEEKYRATGKFREHHRTMNYIAIQLNAWSEDKPTVSLDDFLDS